MRKRKINITLTKNDLKGEYFDEDLCDEDYEYEKLIGKVVKQDKDVTNDVRYVLSRLKNLMFLSLMVLTLTFGVFSQKYTEKGALKT